MYVILIVFAHLPDVVNEYIQFEDMSISDTLFSYYDLDRSMIITRMIISKGAIG